MSFAQEIRDFTSAFKAMNDALGDPLDRASKQADIDWKNAQRDKWRWDMGAEDRERQDILSFGSTSEIPWGTQPSFTPTSLKGLGTTGSNVNIAGFSNEFGSGLSRMYADMPDNIKQAVRVRSGYRPYDQQYDIYYRQGIRPAAKPGNSRHEFGMALDWDFGSSDAKRWVYQNAGNYGFEFPLPDSDPNHMQYAAFKGPRGEDASRAYQRSLSGRQVASLDDISLPGTEAVGLVDDEAVRGMEGMFGGEMGRYRDAIGRMETGGEKNPYGTVHKGGALGRYGVMPSNLAAFTQQVLGTVMTSSCPAPRRRIRCSIVCSAAICRSMARRKRRHWRGLLARSTRTA
jgi:hypothetical protein